MDEDDIAVRGFRSYFGALGLLERGCGWDRRTAHAELMDAVNDGRVRRKSDPNPPQPKYDSGNWNEHHWETLADPVVIYRDGSSTPPTRHDGKPAFTKEEYSAADIERLADKERTRHAAQHDAGGREAGGQERVGPAQSQSTDGSAKRGYGLSDAKLAEEMHQLITSGQARSRWDAANLVAPKAEGHGTLDSKARRLYVRYRAFFLSE